MRTDPLDARQTLTSATGRRRTHRTPGTRLRIRCSPEVSACSLGRTSSPDARPTIFRVSGHLPVKDQRGQDRIVPAPDDDLPFVLNVESAFWITGRGTVIMGVIEQGVVHIGDHLEVIQPSSADTVAPPRLQCLDASPMSVSGRDYAALGYPIGILVGPDIEPDAIRPGAKLRAVGPLAGH